MVNIAESVVKLDQGHFHTLGILLSTPFYFAEYPLGAQENNGMLIPYQKLGFYLGFT